MTNADESYQIQVTPAQGSAYVQWVHLFLPVLLPSSLAELQGSQPLPQPQKLETFTKHPTTRFLTSISSISWEGF